MTRPRLVVSAALLLAVSSVLAGCSGSSSGDGGTPPAAGSTSGGPASGTMSSGAPSGRPTKQEVVAGIERSYGGTQRTGTGLPDLAGCIADKGYDTWSERTLRALADGDPLQIDPADVPGYASAMTACATGALRSAVPGMSLPSMPDVSLPSMPDVSLPSMPDVSLPSLG